MRTRRSGPPILDRQTYDAAEGILHSRIRVMSRPARANGGAVTALLANGGARNILRAWADATLAAGEPTIMVSDGDGGIIFSPVSLIAKTHKATTPGLPKSSPVSKREVRKAEHAEAEARKANAIAEARALIERALPGLAYRPGFAG